MKSFFILPVPYEAQPATAPFKYPRGNRDFGIEQDFLQFTARHGYASPTPATDYHYLPVFWTRWLLHHDYGRSGVEEFEALISPYIIDATKTFSVCQFDGGPPVSIPLGLWFLASREGAVGIDVPLLSWAIPQKFRHANRNVVERPHFISFIGRVTTHTIRRDLPHVIAALNGLIDNDLSRNKYFKILASSVVTAAPRGFGGSSFRFFEAMAVGSIPVLISEIDTRPFPDFINWDDMSFFVSDASDIPDAVGQVSFERLQDMSRRAHWTYWNLLAPGAWPRLLFRHLGISTSFT